MWARARATVAGAMAEERAAALAESLTALLAKSLRVTGAEAHYLVQRLLLDGGFTMVSARNDGYEMEVAVCRTGELDMRIRVCVDGGPRGRRVAAIEAHPRWPPGAVAHYTHAGGWGAPVREDVRAAVGHAVASVVGALVLPPVPGI